MQVVAAYSKPEEAYLAASLLEANGIEAAIWDADTVNLYWLYSNAIGGVKVAVPEEDAVRAREVLDLPPAETGFLVCPHCGSDHVHVRELGLWTALAMVFLNLLIPGKSRMVDCLDCGKSFDLEVAKAAGKSRGGSSPPYPTEATPEA